MTRWRAPDLTRDERAALDSLDSALEAEAAWGAWTHADRASWERMLAEVGRGRERPAAAVKVAELFDFEGGAS